MTKCIYEGTEELFHCGLNSCVEIHMFETVPTVMVFGRWLGHEGGVLMNEIVIVQLLSCFWLFATPWTAARQASLSFIISWSLLKLMSIESMIPSNHLILCCPILLLPSIFLSNRVFSNESVLCLRGPKYWSFSFSISLSNVYSGLISFRTDWFDLAIQGTHKSLLQHHSSKASILQHSAFFMVHLSHSYMTIGNGIALAIQTCVSKVMFLLFNMLSRFVIAFLTRSKCLLISWLQSSSAVIFELKKILMTL